MTSDVEVLQGMVWWLAASLSKHVTYLPDELVQAAEDSYQMGLHAMENFE